MNEHDLEEEEWLKGRKERRTERKIASKKDRTKFKKTDHQKRKKLLQEQMLQKLQKKELLRGRVLSILPEGIIVEDSGEKILCFLSGLLKKEVGQAKNLVTIGDFVHFEKEKKLIVLVEERRSVLARQEHLYGKKEQYLAANIDQVLITVSVVAPSLKPSLVDRYIIATRKGNMEPIIVVNKIDLLEDNSHEKALFDTFKETYEALEIPIIAVSASTGKGIPSLIEHLKEKSSVFSGQSGVGKSSLINTVTGSQLETGGLAKTQKGSHTTTNAQLVPLPCGGWCIDTPGIRSFGLWELKREDLEQYFPEISELGTQCKYPNCSHSHEPQCAVQLALAEHRLSPLRFESYRKLLEEIIYS